jgi:restriction system protein
VSRKNESILNQLAVLPWWMTLIIAAIIYPTIRFVLPAIPFDNHLISALTQGVSKVAYLILVPLIAVAIFSFFNQIRKGKMLENQTGLESIKNLSWRQFEELVGEVFRRQGYLVLENPSDGPDGGIDLRLRKNGQITLVQCKHWKSKNVGVSIVRELYGVMTAAKANHGILATFGNFTQEAKNFAKGKPIHLITGNKLAKLISEVQESGMASTHVEPKMSCPKCGSEMVLRTAKKGKYAGQKFWGCSEFPKCRSVIKYEVK